MAWESGVAPSAPLGFFGGAAVDLRGAGLFAPSIRLGFLYTPWSTATITTGTARFRLLSGRLLACPLRFGSAFAVRACAQLDAGSLEAEGRSVDSAEHHAMPWLAAGSAVRGEYAPLRALTLEAGASLQGLVRSDEFVFRPNVTVYDVPPVSFGVTAGLIASLP
jgi:hypothetical protein